MKSIALILLSLAGLLSGCTPGTDYMVPFRSVPPFDPQEPNELRAELTRALPAEVEIRHFLCHQKADEMRGLVLVKGTSARRAVCDAIRRNPRLSLAGRGPEPVDTARESMICFSSQPSFQPEDEDALLDELQRGLPPGIKPRIFAWRRDHDTMALWITVRGNFGKEAVKYVLWQNPNLKLLQVEDAPPFAGLSFWWHTHLSGRETDWHRHD
jgi:hypothetical protein